MFKTFTFLLLLLFMQQCTNKSISKSQETNSVSPKPFVKLPKKLKESSGLEWIDSKIYSINDKGGKPELFVFNDQGDELNKVKITNVNNIDWESLAANKTHLFIGDIGNNSGNRKDLSVLKVTLEALNKDKVKAEKIQFEYANQTNYSKQKRNTSFDAEAFIALEDTLVIFTKDWINHSTQIFHLPIDSSNEVERLFPKEEMSMNALITGADYDLQRELLVLCGYDDSHNYIWIFKKSNSQRFLSDDWIQLKLDDLDKAQIEGIALFENNQILISTEETKDFKPQLWSIELPLNN